MPLDRRVWQSALALRRAGWDVDVVCPRGQVRDVESAVVIEGVRIHRYQVTAAAGSRTGYLREYAQAFRHVRRIVRTLVDESPADIIHVCNPPDVMVPICRLAAGRGPRLIFDHHDLVPELYAVRYGGSAGPLSRLTRAAERLAYRLATVVIVPNDSYRAVAVGRGRRRPGDVFVVRNAPDLERFVAVPADPTLRHGRTHLLAYLGVMGPQDGVDHALRALAKLRTTHDDWHATFMGDGDVLPAMVRLAGQLRIADRVEFTGMIGDPDILRVLSTADVCLAPDPGNAFNDRSTMNKIVEYMAMGRPVVAYDLPEARISADGAALFAPANDVGEFAARIGQLLDDEPLRQRLGAVGRTRVEAELNWRQSEEVLLRAYDAAYARR